MQLEKIPNATLFSCSGNFHDVMTADPCQDLLQHLVRSCGATVVETRLALVLCLGQLATLEVSWRSSLSSKNVKVGRFNQRARGEAKEEKKRGRAQASSSPCCYQQFEPYA